MASEQGEKYDYEVPVKPEGNVEDWMNRVDDEMKSTLQVITKRSTFTYAASERVKWIKE